MEYAVPTNECRHDARSVMIEEHLISCNEMTGKLHSFKCEIKLKLLCIPPVWQYMVDRSKGCD